MSFANALKKIFGTKADKDMKAIRPILDKILAQYEIVDKLSDDDLRQRSADLRKLIAERIAADEKRLTEIKSSLENPEIDIASKQSLADEQSKLVEKIDKDIESVLDEILPEAYAIMKSTARRFKENETITVTATEFDRWLSTAKDFVTVTDDKAVYRNSWMAGGNMVTWDMVHYDVQLIGGIVLHQGKIAEMATGEGKTLVATLPVFLNALAGKGVHVVTVNDYLSKRDSEWMGPLYMFHGLKVDCIDKHEPNSPARKSAYNSDITFGTNNEFGFDYLRDNMAIGLDDLVQRKLHFAIVDEVDSVLIDDARTPLIISGAVGKTNEGDEMFVEYRPYVAKLYEMQKQLVMKIFNDARAAIADGSDKELCEKLLYTAFKGLPKYKPIVKYLLEPDNKAILEKGEATFTAMKNQRMSEITDELYFAIDEQQKSVELTEKGNEAIGRMMGDDDVFLLPNVQDAYEILRKEDSGEEQRAEAEARLLEYSKVSERVHTVHQLLKAYTMFEKEVDYVIIDNKVKIVDEQTGRIMEGRRWSDGLHQAVEAKENVKVEAATQTFATISLQNYFRMYHKLAGMTGTAETEAGEFWDIYKLDVVVIPTNRPVIRDDQNDLIYKSKNSKYKAVIDHVVRLQKEGRPVLVGTTSVEVSEVLSRMMTMRGIKHDVLNAKQHAREAEIVAQAGQMGHVTIATNMAGRGTDIKLSPEVKAAGGLAIIGTERHDSRRVDRQLRGRAGRQGDPGSSTFYVSFEDNLMRLFGTSNESIRKFLDGAMEEGESMQNSMLSRSIEKAQRKVEENNFGIRKHLLEYDDVMNNQRQAIYSRRRNALNGDLIDIDVQNMMLDYSDSFVEQHRGVPYEKFTELIMSFFAVAVDFDADFYQSARAEDLADRLCLNLREAYSRRMEAMVAVVNPVIRRVYETQGAVYQNIAIPVDDGRRQLTVSVNLKKAYESNGWEVARTVAKFISLIKIDEYWKEHLRDMDDLKTSVQNESYAQKDPLLMYKLQSFDLFKEVLDKINKDTLAYLLRVHIPLRDDGQQKIQEAQRRRTDMSRMRTERANLVTNGGEQKSNGPVHVEKKVGRNDPCPCGSGKKYKNCHGRDE